MVSEILLDFRYQYLLFAISGYGYRNGPVRRVQFVKGRSGSAIMMGGATMVPVKVVETCDSPPLLTAEVVDADYMKEPIKLRTSAASTSTQRSVMHEVNVCL